MQGHRDGYSKPKVTEGTTPPATVEKSVPFVSITPVETPVCSAFGPVNPRCLTTKGEVK